MLTGSYNTWLVLASLVIAVLASYTALDLAGRVRSAQGEVARAWLLGGSVAMGIGIWAMHFLGMLAFNLPIPMGYDPTITFLSLLMAIASSAFALWVVCQKKFSARRLCISAVLMGTGVAAMHYSGMEAMRMTPRIQYVPSLVVLSILIAIFASGTALWIAFRLRELSSKTRFLRVGAALVMGLAIAGMHYTGMAAAQFPANSTCAMAHIGLAPTQLAPVVLVFALAALSIALIASMLDLRLEARTASLASSLAYANQELQFLALHDTLTKLPNRALLEDRMEQEMQNAKRESKRFSVLSLDLDGFKQVNDAFGHHAGDLLLLQVADRIRASIRARDTLARIGGDEFVLLANASEPADAASLAGKLVEEIAKPFAIARHEVRVSVSIGIAVFDGAGHESQDLLRNADAAMYHAKAMGRNTYCFFDTSMNDDAHAQSGAIRGAEALLRWNHPTRGMVPPNLFIPAAEKTGLIVPIGEWVLNEACRQMRAWHEAGFTDWRIAVNLSAVQFNHPGLIQMVRDTLDRHAMEPRCLTLEITETTAMRDVHASLSILQKVHEMGVEISIDDFGTGYSSLLYLKRLPASELKIDRGFVCDLAHDTEDAAIIAAIVALGQTLNLRIVAEGVETTEQRGFLSRLGCTSLQGFLFGRPMAAEQFLQLATNPESGQQVIEMQPAKRRA